MSKRTLFLAALAVLGLFAQDEAAFQTEMKNIDQHAAVLRKLSAKTGDDAAVKADEIAKLYASMKEFWTKRKVDDAANWSEEGRVAAVQLASAARAGNAEQAETSFKALGGTCRSCHTAHREKLPDGTFKIK